MSRSMASWSAQHDYINFVDVTEECEKLGRNSSCELAELWITNKPLADGADGNAVAEVAASALPNARVVPTASLSPFRFTNGETPYYIDGSGNRQTIPIYETFTGTIEFGINGLCWYLDATFCSYFHELKAFADAETIKLVLQLIIFALWGTAGLLIVYQVFSAVRVQCDRHGSQSCRTRCRKSLEELASWSLLGTAIRVVLIVSPSLFYVNIFLPCWECYDFEAAALHEVGHILGLGHPDKATEEFCARCLCCDGSSYQQNLYSVAASATNVSDACINTFDYVFEGLPPSSNSDDLVAGALNAIMISFTQFNPQPCLTSDDLQALNAMYPTCGKVITDKPACYAVRHNIGWVRVMVYVLLPGLLTMLFMLCVGNFTQRQAVYRLNSARNLLHKKSMFMRQAQEEGQVQRARAEQALASLQAHRETEDARVEMAVQERCLRMSACGSPTMVDCSSEQSLEANSACSAGAGATPQQSSGAAEQVQEASSPLLECTTSLRNQASPFGQSAVPSRASQPPARDRATPDERRKPARQQEPPYYRERNSEEAESGWLARLELSSKRV